MLQMGICPLLRGAGEEELRFERRGVRSHRPTAIVTSAGEGILLGQCGPCRVF